MGKLIFFASTGVLALLALDPDAHYAFFAIGAVLGPLVVPLFYVFTVLPQLWLIAASFTLFDVLLKRRVPAQGPRIMLSVSGVAVLGFALLVGLPMAQAAHQSHRAKAILAADFAPKAPFPPSRTVEIRLIGTQSGADPHFGPAGCDDLCVDLLAAGVLDRVIFRTEKAPHVLSRELGKGCKSNIFSRRHQARAFRLQLAGVCLVSTSLPDTPSGFEADVTLVMQDDWLNPRFQMRQVQAFGRDGTLLLQQSQLAWTEPDLQLTALDRLRKFRSIHALHKTAGTQLAPFLWPQIAALLGLPTDGLSDSALHVPPGTDPATLTPPDVSFRMLELIAQKGALTDAERLIFVALMLQPKFRATDQTPAALQAVLATDPQHGPAIALALQANVLTLIAGDALYGDDALLPTLAMVRKVVPETGLPPVLAQLSAAQLANPLAAAQNIALAATQAGADPALYLPTVLRRAERESVNFRTAQTHPFVLAVSMPDLNAAICQHADTLRAHAAMWLSWVSHHAAIVGEDRALAVPLGITAARLGLPPDQVAVAFTKTAGWNTAEVLALRQTPGLPCSG